MTSPRASTPFKNLALALTTTIVFVGLVEGIARLLEPPTVQRQEYLWDWKERFKDGEFYTLEKGEGYPPSEENNLEGLRDRTWPVETYPALLRTVVLGDSVTFGHGLEAHEAFPQILNKAFEDSYSPAEVLNVALPGWSTRQERLAYERIARKYKPRVVILAVCLNDLAELQINLAKPPGFLQALFKKSATVRFAMGASRQEIGAVEELFKDPHSPRVNQAFSLFFDEVRALRDEVERDNARLLVVVFPFRFQVEPNAPPPNVQERIGLFGATSGVTVLDFLPELSKDPKSADLFLDYDHFNAAGHRRISDWLRGLFRPTADSRYDLGGTSILFPEGTARGERESLSADYRKSLVSKRETSDFGLRMIRDEVLRVPPNPTELDNLRDLFAKVAVEDLNPRTRVEAARGLYYLGLPPESSVPSLIRGVQHDDPRVRAFATWTLGEMGPMAKDAVPALVALAKKDGGAGKTGALTAIGKIGGDSPDTIPLLLQELKHPKENRRYRAARTIGRMGPAGAPAIQGLIEALKDSSQLVRLTAAHAIGELGEGGKAAVLALTEVVNKDADPEVRKEASATLSKLPGR